MQENLQQGAELEFGGERVAQPPHRGLQAHPLLLDELEPLVGPVDPLVAVARQQPEQEHQRQHEQDRGGALAGGDRGQESDRSETRVDRPHERDHPDLQTDLGDHARQPHPDQRARQIHQASCGERRCQQRQLVEPDRGRPSEQEQHRRPDGMPSVGHRGEHPARRDPAEHPVHCVPEGHPKAHRRRHGGGRQDQQHRHEDELRGNHVAGADRELDARDQGVDRDQQRRRPRYRASTKVDCTGREQQRARHGDEQRGGDRVDEQLALGGPARASLPAAFEQPFGRRVGHVLVAFHQGSFHVGLGSTTPGSARPVRVDVDVVDLPARRRGAHPELERHHQRLVVGQTGGVARDGVGRCPGGHRAVEEMGDRHRRHAVGRLHERPHAEAAARRRLLGEESQ